MRSMDGPQLDERPLFGPGGRIPVAPVVPVPPRGFAAVKAGWTAWHTGIAVVMAPVMFGVYRGAAGSAIAGLGWELALGVAGVLAGVLLALYLPLRGLPRERLSPCFVMPAAMILGAGVLLGSQATPFTATVALALLGFGVVRRGTSLNAC